MNWKNDNFPTAEDWILAEAESYQEKLNLANNTILIFESLNWFQKVFKSKKLFKQYYRDLHRLDREHKMKSERIRREIQEASSAIVKEHKRK
jgi:hypothetical protein